MGTCSVEENSLHISILALDAFKHEVIREHQVLMSDSAMVLAYLKKQGGALSLQMYKLAQKVVEWSIWYIVSISARYIPGRMNIQADLLSHLEQIIPTEYSLLPLGFEDVCKVFNHLHVGLFMTQVNGKLPDFVFSAPYPMVRKEDAFQHLWDSFHCLCFPSICSALSGLAKNALVGEAFHDRCYSLSCRKSGTQTFWRKNLSNFWLCDLLVHFHIKKFPRGHKSL